MYHQIYRGYHGSHAPLISFIIYIIIIIIEVNDEKFLFFYNIMCERNDSVPTDKVVNNQVCMLIGVDYSMQIKQLVDIAMTVLTVLAGLGVLIDPTTQGLNDSDYSLEKQEPTSNDMQVYKEPFQPVNSESDVTVDVDNN